MDLPVEIIEKNRILIQEENIEEFIIYFGGESDKLSEEESSNSESDGSISSDGE